MTTFTREQALSWHRALPQHIRFCLGEAGISRGLIHTRLIGWDGERVTVPIFDTSREIVGYDYFTVTEAGLELSKREGDVSPTVLFNASVLDLRDREVFVCQGLLEQLVLASQMCLVVGPSGDGLAFREEWVRALSSAKSLVICFRGDAVSKLAGARIAEAVPGAVQVELPEGGVQDFFVRKHRRWMDFERMVEEAKKKARYGQ